MKRFLIITGCLLASALVQAGETSGRWVATWATSQQLTEPHNLPPAPGFAEATVRQKLRVSIGGEQFRVRFSNEFGNGPVTFESVHVALADGFADAKIQAGTSRALTFRGATAVTLPPGANVISDPVDAPLAPMADLAITLVTKGAPSDVTGHPGSRTTSYFAYGQVAPGAEDLSDAVRTDHWYFVASIDVLTSQPAAAVAILGDSITDGRGSTTNGNDRWPDILSQRLRANPATAQVAVLNHGVGGGRVLRDGLGVSALRRFDRDVLAQPGVKWLVILEGVNDLGTAAPENAAQTAQDLIAAYDQMITRAHDHGLKVYGATIMPLGGFTMYDVPEREAARQTVNAWIRTGGRFDAVIDFDAVARDPANPARLSAATDGGDHLHLSAEGYKIIAGSIDLGLFEAGGCECDKKGR
ncbi:GDSL-like Lipase/Acylhydrolase [Lacunisphaera limnophila]|uniref:GDSL-like Lipase/Acylhydrolase n=1 Tax=Lacunisphaera limnophila TaxID=1838286 RepID=A0A1D8ARQ1_9BACT|nr:SGNH/GDSL hydrolase family protein [Lacunisphaera limnophila]AOS43575.1 GDSL-like Lipase/Acylhydrolase [Lacunisphaera limnophila]